MKEVKKKIKLIVNEFNVEQIAALPRASLELAKILKDDYRVEIISSHHKLNNKFIVYKEAEGIRVKFYPIHSFYQDINRDYFEDETKKGYLFIFFQNLLGLIKISRVIKNQKNFKIILFLFSSKVKFRELLTFRVVDIFKSTKRLIIHIFFSGFFMPNIIINRAILKLNISYIFCQSKFSTERMKKICKNIFKKVEVRFFRPPALFENGIEVSKENSKKYRADFNISENDFVILHSGLGSLLRGVDYVVEIFEKLKKENNKKNIKLFLAIFHMDKTGTSKKYIEDLKNKLEKKYPKDIIFIDHPHEEIEKIYSCADIAIFPYRLCTDIPDCPLTVVELERFEIPVFVTNIGPIGEYVPGEEFIINYDINKDVKKISKYINNQEYFKKNKNDLERFNEENFNTMKLNIVNFKKLMNELLCR